MDQRLYEDYLENGNERSLKQLCELAENDPNALELLVYLGQNMEDEDFDGKRMICASTSADPVAVAAIRSLVTRLPNLRSAVKRIIDANPSEYSDLSCALRR